MINGVEATWELRLAPDSVHSHAEPESLGFSRRGGFQDANPFGDFVANERPEIRRSLRHGPRAVRRQVLDDFREGGGFHELVVEALDDRRRGAGPDGDAVPDELLVALHARLGDG